MDMAPRWAETMRDAIAAGEAASCPSRRALDALQDASRTAIMMTMVWPMIVAMPFFWAPPLFVLAAMGAAKSPPRKSEQD
jgi:hypothetical protein